MEGMNKFKVLTVVIIFMFLFVVAAIYTNTKDASKGKIDAQNKIKAENFKEEIESDVEQASSTSQGQASLEEISVLNARIDSLSARIDGLEDGSRQTCRVYGVVADDGFMELSVESALNEARDNNKELVLTCSF